MKSFAEILEREGGHIMVLLALLMICVAIVLFAPNNTVAVSLATDGYKLLAGALGYAMKGAGNRQSTIDNRKTSEAPNA